LVDAATPEEDRASRKIDRFVTSVIAHSRAARAVETAFVIV
jgi:hypothetical protein